MSTRRTVLAALLTISLCISLLPAGVTAQSSAVGFGDAEVVAAQGDVATVELRLQNTDQAGLRVRAADQSYRADIDLEDGNGDGRVRVRLDTFRGVDDDPTVDVSAADPADSATLESESTTQEGLVFDAGRYNLIASTESTSIAAVLRLDPPTADGNTTRAVPPSAPIPAPAPASAPASASNGSNASTTSEAADEDGSADTTTDTATDTTRIAKGDHARTRFGVSGLGGILERPAPAADLVSATDATPGATTTHTLATAPTETMRVRELTIDYGAGEAMPTDVYRLARGDIETLGVDVTGDGTVDRSLRIAVGNIRTSTDGTVTLAFDRTITLDANDSVLASYTVTNPETTGPEDVAVTLRGPTTSHTDTGVVRYGPAGQGSLGYGVDLRLVPADTSHRAERVAPLAALDASYDPATSAVVVDTDTDRLETGAYTVVLEVTDAAPEVLPQTTMREQITVVEPSVTFTNQGVPDDPLFTVTADSNLAPGNAVVVRVEADEIGGGVSQVSNCVTEVDANGQISCEFDLTNPASDFAIEVSIARNNETIAGPTAYN